MWNTRNWRAAMLAASAVIGIAGVARADGDPMAAGGPAYTITGLGELGYTYLTYDGPASDDANAYSGTGSVLWTSPDLWNFQGNYSFASSRFDGPNTVDELRIGGGVFWRDATDGAYGGEIHYLSLDNGVENDGFSIAARGEKYLDGITVGGYLGYSNWDGALIDIDGWQLGVNGTYYASPVLAFNGAIDHASWGRTTTDASEWSFRAEAEYFLPDFSTSVFAGAGFGSLDPDNGATTEQVNFGLGLRVHLGTQGDLRDRHRSEPLARIMETRFGF